MDSTPQTNGTAPVITPRGLEINPDAARPFEAIAVARQMVRTARVAAIATLDPSGYPYSTVTNLLVEPDGTPVFYTAVLALHARNIIADDRVSLTVADLTGPDLLTVPRLTLVGRAVLVPEAEMDGLKARYVDRYAKAKLYLSLPDTRFYRIAVEGVQINGGPARNANAVTPDDLRTELAGAEALLAEAGAIIAASNAAGHADALARACDAAPGRWRIVSIDPDGVDLATPNDAARLWFDARLTDADAVRAFITDRSALPATA